MVYVDCKSYAQEILDKVKAAPNKKALWILSMGDNPASESYIKGKIKDCEYCGIPYLHYKAKDIRDLWDWIDKGNYNSDVAGIIIPLPLPPEAEGFNLTEQINPAKDVDGLGSKSFYKPCTPEAILYLLRKELGDLTGMTALVMGRGKLVGKPVAQMLLDADCTVTVAHSKSKLYSNLFLHQDIIVSAIGKPKSTDLDYCYNADIVVDAGVSRDANGKLCGDCYNFELTEDGEDGWLPKVTPVPNGIGLLTRAMLMAHIARVDVWED